MTPAKTNKKKNLLFGAILYACFAFPFLLFTFLPIGYSPTDIDKCPFDAVGNVVPDRTADGILVKEAGMYFVHRDGLMDSLVARCSGRCSGRGPAPCNGPVTVAKRHLGEVVHVEYCGRTVTGVNFIDGEIYRSKPLTKAFWDNQNSFGRKLLAMLAASFLAMSIICLVKMFRLRPVGTPAP